MNLIHGLKVYLLVDDVFLIVWALLQEGKRILFLLNFFYFLLFFCALSSLDLIPSIKEKWKMQISQETPEMMSLLKIMCR